MNTLVKNGIIALAKENPSEEICGIIYQTDKSVSFKVCQNISSDRTLYFEIDPQDYIAVEQLGRPIGIYHSHPETGSEGFSEDDLESAKELCLPYFLWTNKNSKWHSFIPPTYQIPSEGQPFCWGVQDCYETVRTYYRQCKGVYMTDYDRDESFQNADKSAIIQFIEAEGFHFVIGNGPIRKDDVLLFQTPGTAYPHHLGVFVGQQKVLHHPLNALSRYDPIDNKWLKRLGGVLRYAGGKGDGKQ